MLFVIYYIVTHYYTLNHLLFYFYFFIVGLLTLHGKIKFVLWTAWHLMLCQSSENMLVRRYSYFKLFWNCLSFLYSLMPFLWLVAHCTGFAMNKINYPVFFKCSDCDQPVLGENHRFFHKRIIIFEVAENNLKYYNF